LPASHRSVRQEDYAKDPEGSDDPIILSVAQHEEVVLLRAVNGEWVRVFRPRTKRVGWLPRGCFDV
jgi:hypothetical protein